MYYLKGHKILFSFDLWFLNGFWFNFLRKKETSERCYLCLPLIFFFSFLLILGSLFFIFYSVRCKIIKLIKEAVEENLICNLKNLQLQKYNCPTALAK